MHTWPVPRWNSQFSFHVRPRAFGCPRDGGKRKHAGCDLYAPLGSPVVAITHGRVRAIYEFYGKADAVEVDHGTLGLVRYGEMIAADALNVGQTVESGDVLGTIAQLVGMGNIHPMLHFELYSGKGSGRLTCAGNEYRRRGDLVDPTAFLDRLLLSRFAAQLDVA
jgi:murein DD-endopeptidase MepM/ murein hydrolase activator NlpD